MWEPIKPADKTVQERKERIEAAVVLAKNGRPRSLHERMGDYTIPSVSIAVINDYRLEWACSYGVRKRGEPERVDTETIFQACSISKAVTAIAVLRLAEEGLLDLDADVNLFLESWKVPANGSWQPKITIRQVLSHTAGISVPWFAGYHRDQDIPTLLEILNGEQPSNTPDIRITTIPGMRFRYSGGGYCILQQLLMDVMKQPFPNLMHELVLEPLGMKHSTYAQVYAWPELPPEKNQESKEDAATSDSCVGEYELRSDLSLTISRAGDHLFFQIPGQSPIKLVRQRGGVLLPYTYG